MHRPNILLIYVDQHRFDCVGANQHPLVKTPHLDRLAASGINFTHAFSPIPICIPARASLLTGQWPTRHLAIANRDTEAPRPMRDGLRTFSGVLREAGYRLHWVGKWQLHPTKEPTAFGFLSYVSDAGYTGWRAERQLPPRPHVNGFYGETDPFIRPEESRLAWQADQVVALLRASAGRREPFFIRWDPPEPHLPNVVPEPYASMYPPQAIPPWPSFPDSFAGKPYIQAQQLRTWRLDGWSWQQWAPLVGRYLGEISLLDAQVGRVLAALDELGLAGETLVIYSSDHGDMCGGHGMIDKHYVMYDDVVRVPLIARWPGRIAPATTSDAFVTNALDLAATFCDAGAGHVPEDFQGQSLLPLLQGKAGNGRTDIFAMYHGNQFGLYSQRMVRDRRWKYVWNATAEDELYDLQADPGELHNLALDPRCAAQLRHLRGRLVSWMEAVGDRLLNHWTRPQILEGLTR